MTVLKQFSLSGLEKNTCAFLLLLFGFYLLATFIYSSMIRQQEEGALSSYSSFLNVLFTVSIGQFTTLQLWSVGTRFLKFNKWGM